jgi:hydrogenase nickel incorporation protein HypA/HybF
VHELSICEAIARLAVEKAEGRRVLSVHIQIGARRQVEPESLVLCWEAFSNRPPLHGSVLDVEHLPGVIECSDCGTRRALTGFALRCPVCESGLVRVVSGTELLVTAIEVESHDEPDERVLATPETAKE